MLTQYRLPTTADFTTLDMPNIRLYIAHCLLKLGQQAAALNNINRDNDDDDSDDEPELVNHGDEDDI